MHHNEQIENKIHERNCVSGKRKTEKIINLNGTDGNILPKLILQYKPKFYRWAI